MDRPDTPLVIQVPPPPSGSMRKPVNDIHVVKIMEKERLENVDVTAWGCYAVRPKTILFSSYKVSTVLNKVIWHAEYFSWFVTQGLDLIICKLQCLTLANIMGNGCRFPLKTCEATQTPISPDQIIRPRTKNVF